MNTKNLPWKKLRENVFFKNLARNEDKNFQIDIIKLEPNIKFPEHVHPDVEWIYILEGSMADERGEFFVNHFIINEKNSKHTVVSGEKGCTILCCWCGKIIPT